jgi:acetyl-CoA synthetase
MTALRADRRGLSTARAVLKVLSLMAQHPEGVSARDVSRALGKSMSTAYDLLASLDEEGFARHEPGRGYRLCAEAGLASPTGELSPSHELSHAVSKLFAYTRKRSYLARVEAGAIVIAEVRGRQGIPRVPDLGPRIGGNAHALAIGKAVLSLLPEHGRRRYIERGLRTFTPRTITSPAALLAELAQVRRQGFAIDRGEFDAEYCSVAAPVLGDRGRFLGVLAVSTSGRTFDAELEKLVAAVREIATAVRGGHTSTRPAAEGAPSNVRSLRAA